MGVTNCWYICGIIVLYMHNTLLMACKGCSYFLVMFVIREHGKCMLMYATRKIARTHRQILVLTLKTQQYRYFKKRFQFWLILFTSSTNTYLSKYTIFTISFKTHHKLYRYNIIISIKPQLWNTSCYQLKRWISNNFFQSFLYVSCLEYLL